MERVPSQERAHPRKGALWRVYPTQRVTAGRASRSCQWIKGAVIRKRVGERVPSGESDTQQRKVGVSSGSVATVVVEVAAKPMQQLFVILTLNTIGVVEMRFPHSR